MDRRMGSRRLLLPPDVPMDLLHIVLLVIAGIAGGTLSALVGGAAIITFPVLLATGISPVVAVTTNLVALLPGNFLAAAYDRSQLPPLGRSFAGMMIASVVGALAGASLLLVTPEKTFALLVPLLLGFATILFAYAGRIGAWVRARAAARGEQGPHRWTNSIAWLLPVSVYGGYFGAGLGVLLLGVLSIGTGGDYRSANAVKNLVIGLNSLVVAMVFIARGMVAWPQALVMVAGTLIGAIIGIRLAQVVSNRMARVMVVVVGVVLTVAFAWRYWV
jgi:uncharacterized membrane protein YfcA